MLKHRGVCRAAGGEEPPKSEGGWSELYASGGILITSVSLLVELSYAYKHQKHC